MPVRQAPRTASTNGQQGQDLLARRAAKLARQASEAFQAEIAERKRAEEALAQQAEELRRSEEALRDQTRILQSILDSMGHGVIVTDENGKFLLFNPEATRIHGVGATDVTPEQWTDQYGLFLPDTVTPYPPKELPLARAMRGEPVNEELFVRHSGASEGIWVSVNGRPLRDEEGALRGGVVVIRDITERKRMEAALRESEERYRSLVEACPDAVTQTDLEGNVLLCNQRAAALHGFKSVQEVLGKNAFEFIAAEDRERAMAGAGKTLETGHIRNVEYSLLRQDGSRFAAELSASLLVDTEGKPKAFTAVVRDITERKRVEEALRTSEQRTRLIVDLAHDAFVAIDADGVITDWNPQAEVIFGWSREQAIGRPLAETIIPSQHREAHRRGLRRFRATGQGPLLNKRIEITALHRDGHEFPVELTISPIKIGAAHIFASFVHDITERKQAQEELRKARDDLERRVEERTAELSAANALLTREINQRQQAEEALEQRAEELARSNAELEQFAYVASHDLQEPLRMVASYLQLLERRYKGRLDADANDFIAYAVDGATRMQTLISDLLAYSRVGTHGRPSQPTDCQDVFERAVADLQAAIEESGAVVSHDPQPLVMADATQLGQLFRNLIGNAIKFRSERRPEIHVGAERTDGYWRFSIRDNGIGIDPEYAERIFVIFQRLHGRADYPGTGIGLAICKKIVERHGGRIWVESQPGMGSTFYFTIPHRGGDPS